MVRRKSLGGGGMNVDHADSNGDEKICIFAYEILITGILINNLYFKTL